MGYIVMIIQFRNHIEVATKKSKEYGWVYGNSNVEVANKILCSSLVLVIGYGDGVIISSSCLFL